MSTLRDYLLQKRAALLKGREKTAAEDWPHRLQAKVKVEGRSGVRRIHIREHQVLSDSDRDFAGYNFGPGSPELQLGVLGSCLAHIFLIQAADRQVPLDSLEVEVSCEIEPRAGQKGFEQVPRYPHNIEYTVHVESPASADEIGSLHAAVEAVCPVLNLLVNPQQIKGSVVLTGQNGIAATVGRGFETAPARYDRASKSLDLSGDAMEAE
jgi:uncharacterized OsmC-like protein